MLELADLGKRFGGVQAVEGLDLSVRDGEIVGLIGPNGSGKSTTVNLVCSVYPVSSGQITFEGRDITSSRPHRVLAAGIARTFQNIRLFNHLTVWQNLWVAENAVEDRKREGFVRRWLSGSKRARESMNERLEFSGLAHKRDELAANPRTAEPREMILEPQYDPIQLQPEEQRDRE